MVKNLPPLLFLDLTLTFIFCLSPSSCLSLCNVAVFLSCFALLISDFPPLFLYSAHFEYSENVRDRVQTIKGGGVDNKS